MDPVFLSRLQFAITAGFHFIFPPITIGLAWLLVIVEWRIWRRDDSVARQVAHVFSKLLGITFAVGVATGILLEFQFGTNWARYSRFVGDIFGAPLAAEGVLAFFLESTFLGLYLFGRRRVSKGMHWFAILMVAVGSAISAFWILVANSWQQTPAGYVIRNGRAELESFWAAVFNPSTLPRFFHTLMACLVAGAFVMAGVAAYRVLKHAGDVVGRSALRTAIVVGFVASLLTAFPTGHEHARQVARTQPEKFAAIEGLYTSQESAPLVLFGWVQNRPPTLHGKVEVTGILSWLAFGDASATVRGIDEFPPDEIPPLWLTFVSFHNMVILGMLFIAVMTWGLVQLWRDRLYGTRWLLRTLVWCIPLPVAATQFGWMAAEVGRQPWIVYGLLKTADAHSSAVQAGEVVFSILLFGAIYLGLGVLWVYLMVKEAKHGLEAAPAKEVTA
jgi:cytochrome d ubiquinol oxidase subunit I